MQKLWYLPQNSRLTISRFFLQTPDNYHTWGFEWQASVPEPSRRMANQLDYYYSKCWSLAAVQKEMVGIQKEVATMPFFFSLALIEQINIP